MSDRLDFEIDTELETGLITGHAGVPGLIEAFRQTGTAAVIDREVKLKSRRRGLSASEMVESLLAMWAAGGERAEDLDQFRQGKALGLLLGHELPAAQTGATFSAISTPKICRCCRRANRALPPRRYRYRVWPRPMPSSSRSAVPPADQDGDPRHRRHRDRLRQTRRQTHL
jgi:hypothetical protein